MHTYVRICVHTYGGICLVGKPSPPLTFYRGAGGGIEVVTGETAVTVVTGVTAITVVTVLYLKKCFNFKYVYFFLYIFIIYFII